MWSLREARLVARWPIDAPTYPGRGRALGKRARARAGRTRRVAVPTLHGIHVVELASGRARVVPAPATLVYQIAFVPGRDELVVAAQDDVFRVALDGRVLATYAGAKLVEAIGVAADGQRVVATGLDGTTVTWDAASGHELGRDARAVPFRRADETLAVEPDPAPAEVRADRVLAADCRSIVELADRGVIETIDRATSKRAHRVVVGRGGPQQLAGVSDDGNLALLVDSATLRVAQLESGHTFTLATDGDDWLLSTEDGYFDGSRNAGAMLAAGRDLEVFRIDQLAVRNNRPDIILERLDRLPAGERDAIAYYRGRYLHRLAALGLDETALGDGLVGAPHAAITRADVDGDHAIVGIDLTATRGELLAYDLYVNGVAVHGGDGERASGTHLATEVTIPLAAGDNRMELGALGSTGVELLRPTRVVRRTQAATRRELYFVGFGVSVYKNATYNLVYPSKDVADLADVLQAAPGFDAVHVETYPDAKATVGAFATAKQLLAHAGVDDTVVVFVAGHGLHAQDASADYYFATYEVDIDDLAHTAAPFEVIEGLLDGIAARGASQAAAPRHLRSRARSSPTTPTRTSRTPRSCARAGSRSFDTGAPTSRAGTCSRAIASSSPTSRGGPAPSCSRRRAARSCRTSRTSSTTACSPRRCCSR